MNIIDLPFRLRKPVLACGADTKGAFAVAKGGRAYLEDGFGDLIDADNLERYEKAVSGLLAKLGARPKAVICDMHPGYSSAHFAANAIRNTRAIRNTQNAILYKVQHHEAHVAAAIIDGGIKGAVIGVAFDGTGYGADGNIWGGEFLAGGLRRFERAAHLAYVPAPGGDAAAREPWRMASSYLYAAYGGGFVRRSKDRARARLVKEMVDRRLNSPLTSSAGRLFDAAASIILRRDTASAEAELPMALESLASGGGDAGAGYGYRLVKEAGGGISIDMSPAVKAVAAAAAKGEDPAAVSARFHDTVASMVASACRAVGKRTGIRQAALTGGVFRNRRLADSSAALLSEAGFRVFRHRDIDAGDAGIPVGQIAIAHARGVCV